jgi:hypothetical protein
MRTCRRPRKRVESIPPTLIYLRHDLLDGQDAGFLAEAGEVGTDKTVRDFGDLFEVDVVTERHMAAVHLEDVEAAFLIGNRDENFTVEAAWSAERGVDSVRQSPTVYETALL